MRPWTATLVELVREASRAFGVTRGEALDERLHAPPSHARRPLGRAFARLVAIAAFVALAAAAFEFLAHFGQICLWGATRIVVGFSQSRGVGAIAFQALEALEIVLYGVIAAAMATFALGELHAAVARKPRDPRHALRRIVVAGTAMLVLVAIVWLRISIHAVAAGIAGWDEPAQAPLASGEHGRDG